MTKRTLLVAVAAVALVCAGIGWSQARGDDPRGGSLPLNASPGAGGHRVPLGALRAGTCFDVLPRSQDAVQVFMCARPHHLEAFAVVSLQGGPDVPYPGDAALRRRARLACERALVATRHVSLGETSYGLFPVVPIEAAAWQDANRRVVCALFPLSMQRVTGRLR